LAFALLAAAPLGAQALGPNRITQADVTGGALTVDQIRRAGLEIFTTPFRFKDGYGDGPEDPLNHVAPGGRPTSNGTWLRVNGLDSQTCSECHGVVSNATVPPTLGIGGVGGNSASAFPASSFLTPPRMKYDIDDNDLDPEVGPPDDGIAGINGRLINPPFLFGSGGVELVAKEMTEDLQLFKAKARANPGLPILLVTHGVSFGTLVYNPLIGDFDYSGVEGLLDPVANDLVVRPFGRKGNNATVRQFDEGAMRFHHGMQPVESSITPDDDLDGVTDEVLIGEMSALHIFATNMERPVQVDQTKPDVQQGFALFVKIGCATCHVPAILTREDTLLLAFPEVHTDPSANVYFKVDLVGGKPGFQPNGLGGVVVNMYSDLKRHDMGSLSDTTGNPTEDRTFVTARLWGVGDTAPYLHDGRALTVREAIEAHDGEAYVASQKFQVSLTPGEQKQVLTFLCTLRDPKDPASDISKPRRQPCPL